MKILITSGGGAKGAFSVGALQYLQTTVNINQFDFISGTSTGALIAALTAAGKVDTLTDVYLNTLNGDILKPQNIVDSITQGRPYIYDTDPLMQQIKTYVDAATYKTIMDSATTVCFNSICLQTGKVNVFSTKNINPDQHYDNNLIGNRTMMINAMLGSSNQAVFMNPVLIDNFQFVDGGNREVIPSRVVVNNLSKVEPHDIYILSNNPIELVRGKDSYDDILSVLLRAISIFIQEVRENDMEVLATFKKISPTKIRIFYIYPPEELDPEFSTGLRFSKILMQKWMRMGKTAAKNILSNYPDGNI